MTDFRGIEQLDEHTWLHEILGSWYVACAYYTSSDAPPIKVQGSETVSALGPYWVVCQFEADMMGSVISGLSTIGFDPVRGLFNSSWVDSSTPFLYRLEGHRGSDNKVLNMTGRNIDPTSGELVRYRGVERRFDLNRREFELFLGSTDTPETRILHYVYTRKKG